MIMPDLITRFLADLEAEGMGPNTVKAYAQDLRAWAKWYDQTTGGQALTAADPRDIRDFQAYMVRQGWKPARPCGRGWPNGRGIPMRMIPTSSWASGGRSRVRAFTASLPSTGGWPTSRA